MAGQAQTFETRLRHERLFAQLLRSLLLRTAKTVPASDLGRSAVIFSPHPDDESLGCGGTILKKRQAGARVHLVHMTDGGASTTLIPHQELKKMRRDESLNAAGSLGVTSVDFLEFPDGHLHDHTVAAVEQVTGILDRESPEEIFIPYRREPMRQAVDHLTTTAIVQTALGRFRRKVLVWEYPVWFWLHWPWVDFRQPVPPLKAKHVLKNSVLSVFGLRALIDFRDVVDISEVQGQKEKALAHHRSQMEQLIEDPRWITLGHLSNGEFLNCFYQPHEFFCRSIYDGVHGRWSSWHDRF